MLKPVLLLYTLPMAVTTAIYSQTYERLVSLEPRTSTFVLLCTTVYMSEGQNPDLQV